MYIRNVKCLLHSAANTKEKSSFSVQRVEMEIFVLAKALGSHTWRHQLFEIPIKPYPFSWHWNWKRQDRVACVCDCECVSVTRVDKRRSGSVLSVVTGERYYRHHCSNQGEVFNVKCRVSSLWLPTYTCIFQKLFSFLLLLMPLSLLLLLLLLFTP
jgi:hypothetical protein